VKSKHRCNVIPISNAQPANAPSTTPSREDEDHATKYLCVANVPQMANVNQGEQCKCQKYDIEVPPLPMMATPSLAWLRIDFPIDCHVVDHGNHLTTNCVSVATVNKTNDVEQPLDFTLPLPVGQRLANAPSITPNRDDDEHTTRDRWEANVPQMANVNQGEQCKCQKYAIEVPPLPMMTTSSLA
jgi:hypothetical protein